MYRDFVRNTRIANILDNAGQVFLGATVISPLLAGADYKFNTYGIILLGTVTTVTTWAVSVFIERTS